MRRFVVTAWAVGVVTVSTVPLAAGYRAWWAALVLVGCVLAPTLLVALGRLLRIGSAWIAVGVGLVAVIAGAALGAGAVDAQGAGTGPLAVLWDLVPRLLTAPRPAPTDPVYLAPAAMLTWLVALAVALAVTAPGRARVAPLLGAVTLQVAGALLTAGAGDPHGLVAMASIALLLIGWVTIPVPGSRRAASSSRTVWLTSAVAAAVIGTLALPAAALTTGDRFEPSLLIDAPRLPAQAAHPVPDVAYWNLNADLALFTVTSSTGPAPQRMRLAVLPDFDGASWTLDGELRPVGVVAEPDLAPGIRQQSVTYRIEPVALDSAWLPSLGRAQQVTGADPLMDTHTGSLVTTGPPDGAITVTAHIDAPTDGAVARAGVPPESEAARYVDLPAPPAELVAAAHALTEDAQTRWEQITALADFVRGERILDQGAPSGGSYGRVLEFLFADEAAGGQVGTTEQFASSFAVLARALGIPTRLVVGFSTGKAGADTTTVMTGGDARVWAEAYLSRAGWVTVDPSPDSAVLTEHTPPPGDTEPAAPTPAPSEAPTGPPPASEATSTPAAGESGGGGAATALGVLGLIGGAGATVLLVLAALRTRRRRRWRIAGAPGAWAHLLDALGLAGVTVPVGAAPETVAALVPGSVDGLGTLTAQAQRRAWAPADTPVPGQAEPGWDAALQAERALRARSTWWRRLVWHVSPRPLGRASR